MSEFIKVIVISTILISMQINIIYSQGIIFNGVSWDQALYDAAQGEKPIFVDVYTDWCAPCKRMDQTTFVDSEVGSFFNEKFISIKANAEDNGNGSLIAQRYKASGYPTLLFISSSGELILEIVGMKTQYELLASAKEALELYEQFDYLQEIKANVHAPYSLEELKKILDLSHNHSFDGKEVMSMRYMDLIDAIAEDDLRRVMGEIQLVDLPYLSRLAPMTTSVSYGEMSVRRNAKEWIKWRSDTEFTIDNRIKTATEKRDFQGFESVLSILKSSRNANAKTIDKLYYNYYRRNDLDQYKTFASYLITEYIIPTRPAEVAAADEKKYRMLNEESQKGYASQPGNIEVDHGIDPASVTPFIDSLSEIFTISRSIADQLFEVSGDFYAFYEDDSSQRKSIFWASLAAEYFPYDLKYYDNHIYLLEASGQIAAAQEIKQKMLSLPWYNEMKIKAQQNQASSF